MGCSPSRDAVIVNRKSAKAAKVVQKYTSGIHRNGKANGTDNSAAQGNHGNGTTSTSTHSNGTQQQQDTTAAAADGLVLFDQRLPLTQRQIYAITRSWKAITRNMSDTAVNMFVRLFETNTDLKDMFKVLKNVEGIADIRQNRDLENHAMMVMCTLDEAISNLDDLDYTQELLHKVGKSHQRFPDYKASVFYEIEEPFMLAIKETLGDRCNVSLELTYRRTIKFLLDSLAYGFEND